MLQFEVYRCECIYSGFEVTCPDCDLKSALDHAARDNERHSSSLSIQTLNCVSTLRTKSAHR